jgi:hypothetical protein
MTERQLCFPTIDQKAAKGYIRDSILPDTRQPKQCNSSVTSATTRLHCFQFPKLRRSPGKIVVLTISDHPVVLWRVGYVMEGFWRALAFDLVLNREFKVRTGPIGTCFDGLSISVHLEK